MNLSKSQLIGIGVVPNLEVLATNLGCQVGSLLFRYLGLPLGARFKNRDVGTLWLIGCERNLQVRKLNFFLEGGELL